MDVKIDIIASLVLIPKMIFWIFIHPKKTTSYMLIEKYKEELPSVEVIGAIYVILIDISISSDVRNARGTQSAEALEIIFGFNLGDLTLILPIFLMVITASVWLSFVRVPLNRHHARASGRVAIVILFLVSLAELCRVVAQSAGDPGEFYTLSEYFAFVPLVGYAITIIYTIYYFFYSMLEYRRSHRT